MFKYLSVIVLMLIGKNSYSSVVQATLANENLLTVMESMGSLVNVLAYLSGFGLLLMAFFKLVNKALSQAVLNIIVGISFIALPSIFSSLFISINQEISSLFVDINKELLNSQKSLVSTESVSAQSGKQSGNTSAKPNNELNKDGAPPVNSGKDVKWRIGDDF